MLAMISPANTTTEITDRGYPNVNRVCGRDDVQGPVGARFAVQDLKLKSVYIIQDKTLYGQGVADIFRAEAEKLGMKILGYEGTEERANFSPLIIPLKARNPDLVYFGGIYHQGGLLLKQLRERGVKARFMGPDGLDSPEMVKIGGRAVTGSYYTTVAGPPDAYPETASFTKKFKQRFGRDVESFAHVRLRCHDGRHQGDGRVDQSQRRQAAEPRRGLRRGEEHQELQRGHRRDPVRQQGRSAPSQVLRAPIRQASLSGQSSQSHRAASAGGGEEIVSWRKIVEDRR